MLIRYFSVLALAGFAVAPASPIAAAEIDIYGGFGFGYSAMTVEQAPLQPLPVSNPSLLLSRDKPLHDTITDLVCHVHMHAMSNCARRVLI